MTSQKEKRGAISARRRRQLLLLVTELQKLQPKFPDIQGEIQDISDDLTRLAERTREADRQDVLNVLIDWQGVPQKVEEIMEDTGLSERTVRGVLEEFEQSDPPTVIVSERPKAGERGRAPKVYRLA